MKPLKMTCDVHHAVKQAIFKGKTKEYPFIVFHNVLPDNYL
jgi:hypothetical protein